MRRLKKAKIKRTSAKGAASNLPEKQFKNMSLDEVFDLEARHTANVGSGLKGKTKLAAILRDLQSGVSTREVRRRHKIRRQSTPSERIAEAYMNLHLIPSEWPLVLVHRDLLTLDMKVANAALECFESINGALNWLTSSEISLRGRRPLDVAKTPRGAACVVTLLKRIDYNIAS